MFILHKKEIYFGYNHYMLCGKNKKSTYILCFVLTCYTIYDTMNSLVRKGEKCVHLSGMQKMTLLDYPGKVACTVFTSGCNFRCPFCHNASLVLSPNDEKLDEEALFDFLKKRKGILDGVVITGGEPLLYEDIVLLLMRIKGLGYKIKLDTNGTNPKLLKEIVLNGLVDRVAMDIKSSPENYSKAVGIDNFDISSVAESKDFLLNGEIEYEFRTTVVKGIHTKDDLINLAKWISGAKEYYLQQFKDSGNLISPNGLDAFNESEINNFAEAVREYVPAVAVRGI